MWRVVVAAALLILLPILVVLVLRQRSEPCAPASPCQPVATHVIANFELMPRGAGLTFAPDSTLLSMFGGEMASADQRLWRGDISMLRVDLATGQEAGRYLIGLGFPAYRVLISPDRTQAALLCYPGSNKDGGDDQESGSCLDGSGAGLIVSTTDAREIDIISLAGPAGADTEGLLVFPGSPALPPWASWAAQYLPGETLVIDQDVASSDLVLHSAEDQRPIRRFSPDPAVPFGRVVRIMPSPSGRFVAAVYIDVDYAADIPALIRVWEVDSGTQIASFVGRAGTGEYAVWTPDETRIVTAVTLQPREGEVQVVLDLFELPR